MSDDETPASDPVDEASFEDWNHPDLDDFDDFSDLDAEGRFPEVFIGDLRPGETLDQRNARLARKFRRETEEDRPEGKKSDPLPMDLLLRRMSGERPTKTEIRGSAVKVIDEDGTETWRELGVDDEAVRTFVEAHAFERGFSVEDLRRPFPAGRQRPKEKLRRRVLAEIVAAADEAGAKTSALEQVLGLGRRRISELRGSESTPL